MFWSAKYRNFGSEKFFIKKINRFFIVDKFPLLIYLQLYICHSVKNSFLFANS